MIIYLLNFFLNSRLMSLDPACNLIGEFTKFRSIKCIIMVFRWINLGLSSACGSSSSLLSSYLTSDTIEYLNILVILFQFLLSLLNRELKFTVDFCTLIKFLVLENEFSDFRLSQSGTNFLLRYYYTVYYRRRNGLRIKFIHHYFLNIRSWPNLIMYLHSLATKDSLSLWPKRLHQLNIFLILNLVILKYLLRYGCSFTMHH